MDNDNTGPQGQGNNGKNRDDPSRMEFKSKEERELVKKIRTRIENDPEIDQVTDYTYAQLALALTAQQGGNGLLNDDEEATVIDGALKAAQHLQLLKEEYDILDTLGDAERTLRNFFDMLGPRVYLSFSFNERNGNYVVIYDISEITQESYKSRPDGVELAMRAMYYICHALTCDLEAIRRGHVLMCECEEYDFKKNMDVEMTKKIYREFTSTYPVTYQRIKFFHSGVIMNMVNSLTKKVLPARIIEKMDLACNFDRNLGEIYLVPTPEAACERVYRQMTETLALRYRNERSFRIDTDDDKLPKTRPVVEPLEELLNA